MLKKYRIVADENIPLLDELFAGFAEIERIAGREIQNQQLKQADILLVRSVTQVNKALLEHTAVKFVGTCTIGTDHIDLAYLAQQHIAFANAPGCNARAVVDYVLAALFAIHPDLSYWQQKRLGIIGYGEVGSRLSARLQQCGIEAICYDPFKKEAQASLEQVLACDAISLHVPLTKTGEHATLHLLNAARIAQLKTGALLINSSRGEVVDNDALLARVNAGNLHAVLDVYEQEPQPELRLLHALDIATAHIAGYSVHGKMRGTIQVAEALYQFLGLTEKIPDYLADKQQELQLEGKETLSQIIEKAYAIRQDSAQFIAQYQRAKNTAEQAKSFDLYRKNYPTRYEFAYTRVKNADKALIAALSALGFICV